MKGWASSSTTREASALGRPWHKMLRPESQVSYHCLIGHDGTRCTLVPETQVAWHAGASSFLGRERCNDFLLGVAFEGDTYALPLTHAQVGSALEWLGARWAPLGWDPGRVTDHRQVSPGRKDDLNPEQWAALHAAIGSRFRASRARSQRFRIEIPAPRAHINSAANE